MCVQRTDKSIKYLLVSISINVWHVSMWPWCQKRISSWCMFRPMTGFITIVTAHVTEGMGQNIKGIFKYCFQRRMSPNGNFHFKKALFFLTKIFLAKYFINCIQKVTRKLCWDFSVAKQVDVQWLGMWICAFLCSLHFCVQRSFNAVTAQMAFFPWLQTPGGRRMSWRYSVQKHCCRYMDLDETSVS